MTNDRLRAALTALLLLLPAGCAVNTSVARTDYSPCHVLGSSDWQARIEIFPNNNPKPYLRRKLVVTGRITTAAGIHASLAPGPVSRLDEPVQQMLVRTEGSAEAGAGPVAHNVRAVLPALNNYGGVEIRCGDGIIARISDVPAPPRGD